MSSSCCVKLFCVKTYGTVKYPILNVPQQLLCIYCIYQTVNTHSVVAPFVSCRSKLLKVENFESYYKKQKADSNCGFAEEYEVCLIHFLSFLSVIEHAHVSDVQF